jgi:hypothetical protein
MTVTLEAHHGSRVKLVILERRQEGSNYSRRLVLTASGGGAGPQEKVVLAGIMRISLAHCQEEVRRLILDGEMPLGRILIEHDVLRWIEPEAYLRLKLSTRLEKLFKSSTACEETYGRLATIFCDSRPAVELLEIVAPEAP